MTKHIAPPLPYEPPKLRYTYLGNYVLEEDFVVVMRGRRFVIPKGAVTDLASTPRFMWMLLPPSGIYEAAAVAHDYWCSDGVYEGHLTSSEADGIFRDMMGEAGVSFYVRWLMWAAVRAAAPLNVRRRPSGVWRDLPLVAAILLSFLALVVLFILGLDKVAHRVF